MSGYEVKFNINGLINAMMFGFIQSEKGNNLQMALSEFENIFKLKEEKKK